MEIDPHTIQQILTKVREQLRCPQCRKRVEVDLESLKVLGESFAVLQLRCQMCEAYIMLHATLSGQNIQVSEIQEGQGFSDEALQNASSKMQMSTDDLKALQKSIKNANGSFSALFETP